MTQRPTFTMDGALSVGETEWWRYFMVSKPPLTPILLHNPLDEGDADTTGDSEGVHKTGKSYLGYLDAAFLFSYAFGMFFR